MNLPSCFAVERHTLRGARGVATIVGRPGALIPDGVRLMEPSWRGGSIWHVRWPWWRRLLRLPVRVGSRGEVRVRIEQEPGPRWALPSPPAWR